MGIRVGEAREYFNSFGGVHVYDTGFRLPYYGPETDWLGIEQDHSHRLSISELLPNALNLSGGLSYLPTNSRLFGVVNVDTGHERHAAAEPGQNLTIAVTRDRLVANAAYRELRTAVRWALDFYAMQEARRRQQKEIADVRAIAPKRARIREVLERHRDVIPAKAFDAISTELEETIETQEQEVDRAAQRAGLLGALATAGIAAVGFEHEISKQITLLEDLAEDLAATDREVDRTCRCAKHPGMGRPRTGDASHLLVRHGQRPRRATVHASRRRLFNGGRPDGAASAGPRDRPSGA